MPQFNPGQSKTALAPITVQPSGLSCEVELFLGPNDATKVVSSGRKPFVSAGSQQQVGLPMVMPISPGTYHVYIDLYVGGSYFAGYTGTEDVVIATPVAPSFNISGSGAGYICPTMTGWWYPDLTFTITNPNAVAVTHVLQLWRRSVSLSGGATENPNAISTPALGGIDNIQMVSPGQPSPIQVTLQPGGSYSYRYTGWISSNYPVPGTIGYITTMARPRSFFYWLQDELGNMSPEVNIVRP